METLNATCLCGTAKLEITQQFANLPLETFICHCDSCRRMTGTLCLTAARLPRYEPASSLLAKLQAYDFSENLRWYFCASCGTHMLVRITEDHDTQGGPVRWMVATGALEQAETTLEVAAHEFIADTLDGGFSDFLQVIKNKPINRWSHTFHKSEILPHYWQSPVKPTVDTASKERLHAHCKCNGVNFWIARPSAQSTMGAASWPDVIIPHTSTEPTPDDEVWWLCDGGKKYLAGICSCDSCRLASGMEWVEWAFVPTIDITLDAEGKVPFSRNFGTLKSFRSTTRPATRYFCGSCGAIVYWTGDERPELIDVAVGLLDAAEGARAESWLEWETKRLSYREDAMPRAESLTLAVEAGIKQYRKKFQPWKVG